MVENARFFALALPLIIALAAIALAEQRYQPYEHVGLAWRLLLSLPLALVMMLAVGRLLWSALARSPMRGTSTFVILCFMPVLAFQLVGYANVAGDREAGRSAVVECVRFIRRARGASDVELTSWADPNRTVTLHSFMVSEADCAARKPVRIVVHQGRLGAEWISTPR